MISNASNSRALSRRTFLRAATAAGIAVAGGHGAIPHSTRAMGIGSIPVSSANASHALRTPADELVSTAPGSQLSWFLAAVNAGGVDLTEADIAAHVAPALLAVVPPPQLIGFMQQLAGGYGNLTLQGATRPPTASQAVGLVAAGIGIQLAFPVTVEADAPHRITGLHIYPSPSGNGEPLVPVAIESDAAPAATIAYVGGRGIYHAEAGSGGPTVVFEAGLTDSGATWAGIIPAVASFTGAVSYDRPNTTAGASDLATMPRTAADAVDDLQAFLEEAALPGPYVLVGHSVGGLFVRLFASRYPDEVAGLVLVDASHEDQDARRQDLVSNDLFVAAQQAISGNTEGIDVEASFAQVRDARVAAPLRSMPLVVLSAGKTDQAFFPAGWPLEEEALLHDELQADLAGLVPGGRRVIAEHSGHYVQQNQPDLVVAAIRDVVDAVRNPDSWDASLS